MGELHGWVGKILRVDLSTSRIWEVRTMDYAKGFISGRGINARLAWEEVGPEIGPFHPENRLMLTTGPLTGTLAPGSGRVTVGGVAPQSYPRPRYTRSGMGGRWGPELKYAGYDVVVVQGRAENPSYLWIEDGEAELKDAESLWGLDTFSTIRALMDEHGPDAKVACIGPAGERLVRIAVIQTDSESAAGQGGFGAVMGSKNLKAIAVRGTGSVKVANPEGFFKACLSVGYEICIPRQVPMEPPVGPNVHIQACSVACRAHCGALYRKNIPGVAVPGLNSSQCHCFFFNTPSMEEFFEAKVFTSRYGLNGWEIAFGMGPWLMICKQERLIEELGGVPVPLSEEAINHAWGPQGPPKAPSSFWLTLMRMVTYREGLGDALAEGTCRAAEKLFDGKGRKFIVKMYPGAPCMPLGYVGHMDAHWMQGEVRWPHWLVSALIWAFDTRDPGSDSVHHFGDAIGLWPKEYGGVLDWSQVLGVARRVYGAEEALDPKVSYEPASAKVVPAIWHSNRGCVVSSLILCEWQFPRIFTTIKEDGYGDTSLESLLLSEATGLRMSEPELDMVGERIFNLERAIEVRYGRSRETDEAVIPYFEQPDMYHGIRLDRERFRLLMDEYYRRRGWDPVTGRPTKEKLEKLGLEDVADQLGREGLLP